MYYMITKLLRYLGFYFIKQGEVLKLEKDLECLVLINKGTIDLNGHRAHFRFYFQNVVIQGTILNCTQMTKE